MALTYSITGGADGAKFSINATTGVLTFKTAPDFEQPGDADHNNVYQVEVGVSDGTSTTKQMINVTVNDKPDTNQPPQITSPAAFTVPENQTAVATVTATDPDGGGTQPPIEPPASGDYPNADNTGSRIAMTSSGSITTSQAGQTISGKKVNGTINVMHPNVEIVDCEVNNIIAHDGDGMGLLIHHVTLVGGSWNSGMSLVNCPGVVVEYNEIRGAENGIWMQSKGIIKDNWFREPGGTALPGDTLHIDGVQVADGMSDVEIRHNHFDLAQGGTSSCITMAHVSKININHNKINGGTYCIYFEGNTTQCNVTENDFISCQFGWVAGTACNQQTYTQNTYAGGQPVDGLQTTGKEKNQDRDRDHSKEKKRGRK